MTPEARARQSIDALLVAAGWAVQDLKRGCSALKAVSHLSIICVVETDLGTILPRARTLQLTSLANMIAVDQ